jgi:hypothetical protein
MWLLSLRFFYIGFCHSVGVYVLFSLFFITLYKYNAQKTCVVPVSIHKCVLKYFLGTCFNVKAGAYVMRQIDETFSLLAMLLGLPAMKGGRGLNL